MIFSKKNLHVLFEAGALLKAIGAAAEIILGVGLLALNPDAINRIIYFVTGDELTEQPRDPLWNFLFHGFNGTSTSIDRFWAFIFIAHGALIIYLVVGLVMKKAWIYPTAAIIFACLTAYQIYHIFYAPSLLLACLSAFDIFFIWLIVQEYRYQKNQLA